jgi:hypothetical protein
VRGGDGDDDDVSLCPRENGGEMGWVIRNLEERRWSRTDLRRLEAATAQIPFEDFFLTLITKTGRGICLSRVDPAPLTEITGNSKVTTVEPIQCNEDTLL